MNQLSVLLPAYNEEENLELMINTWNNYKSKLFQDFDLNLEIIIINDGSSDSTESIAKALCEKHKNVTLINHEVNKGLGQAVKTGISYILNNCPNSKYTCIMDCDNTQDPKYITNMLSRLTKDNSDVVIASRYRKGAKVIGVSPLRLTTSSGARYIYSLLLRVKNVRDYTCGYRLYKNDILKKSFDVFGEDLIKENGFTCMAELLYKLYLCGAKFSEIPFVLRYDSKKGTSKMKVTKTVLDSFKLIIKLRKNKSVILQKILTNNVE